MSAATSKLELKFSGTLSIHTVCQMPLQGV
jgi:hypothetical protein